jgi:hypothetical protein
LRKVSYPLTFFVSAHTLTIVVIIHAEENIRIPPRKESTAARWVTLLLCAFVLLDAIIFGYIAKLLLSNDDIPEELEIRNSYYGLDELYDPRWNLANSSRHGPIVNLPRLAGSVDRSDPHKPSPMEEHLQLTPYGLMAPPDYHMQLSENVRIFPYRIDRSIADSVRHRQLNMIYQFRVIDWGMELCQLALRLPVLGDNTLLDPYVFRGDNDQVLVDVCELDAPTAIDLPRLSWSTKPSCQQHVGTFAARPGSEVTLSQFPCKLATTRSFELSCASQNKECFVDVWASQNQTWGKRNTLLMIPVVANLMLIGLFMYQHQTV